MILSALHFLDKLLREPFYLIFNSFMDFLRNGELSVSNYVAYKDEITCTEILINLLHFQSQFQT